MWDVEPFVKIRLIGESQMMLGLSDAAYREAVHAGLEGKSPLVNLSINAQASDPLIFRLDVLHTLFTSILLGSVI